MRAAYGTRNRETGRSCRCGAPISRRATGCRSCRDYAVKPLAVRFALHVSQGGPNECWPWTGRSDNQTGYGRIREGGRGTRHLGAHRVAYELAHGHPIAPGLEVMHSCDNPPCVNPAHLSVGTTAQNVADRDARGRTATGDRWYAARPRVRRRDPVTPEVALEVLRRDGGCVAVTLGEPPADCRGRLTLDHVRDQPMMGKRAPSDPAHLVLLCEGHHLSSGWATSHRPELREYLRALA